jgi:hypothetical protein
MWADIGKDPNAPLALLAVNRDPEFPALRPFGRYDQSQAATVFIYAWPITRPHLASREQFLRHRHPQPHFWTGALGYIQDSTDETSAGFYRVEQ